MAASVILRSSGRISYCKLLFSRHYPGVSRFSTDSNAGSDSEKKTSKFSFSLDEGLEPKNVELSEKTTNAELTQPAKEQVTTPAYEPASSFFEKLSNANQSHTEKPKTFASMLRQSTLMMLGDFKGARLQGHIIEVQDNDLYIDFGGKFYCVCPRPEPKREYYKGRLVDIQLLEWEMSQKFIGSEKHISLLEADAILLGLSKSRKGVTISEQDTAKEDTLHS